MPCWSSCSNIGAAGTGIHLQLEVTGEVGGGQDRGSAKQSLAGLTGLVALGWDMLLCVVFGTFTTLTLGTC